MKTEYADRYSALYRRHWWWRSREALILNELRRHRPGPRWGRILDVGCGDALLFDALSPFGEVWGIEQNPAILTEAGPHRKRITAGRFDSSYQPGFRFGLILMLDVLEHMADAESALRHASLLLAPGGRLLVTVPAFPILWTAHDDLNAHLARYTIPAFRELARRGGFTVLRARYFFHWMFPAKLLARSLQLLSPPRSPLPPRIPPRWLNNLLQTLSQAEMRALQPLRLPFGSSLLVWCTPSQADEQPGLNHRVPG